MSNDFFNHTSTLSRFTLGRAEAVNAIFAAIAAGFEMLPGKTNLARGRVTFAEDTGAANAMLLAMPVTWTAYEDGAYIIAKVAATNTGAATVNVDSLGVRNIKSVDGSDLAAGDLTAGDFVGLVYDADNTRFLLLSYQRSILDRAATSAASALAYLTQFEASYIGQYANDAAADASGKTIDEGVFYYKNTATKGLRIYRDAAWDDAVLSASDYLLLAGGDMTGILGIFASDEEIEVLSGATPSLDVSAGQVFTLTTSANTTISVTNAPTGRAWTRTLVVTLGGTHTLAITSANWGDAGAPSGLASGNVIKIQLDGRGSTFEATEIWRDS